MKPLHGTSTKEDAKIVNLHRKHCKAWVFLVLISSIKEKKWWLNCSNIVSLYFKELLKMIIGQKLDFH